MASRRPRVIMVSGSGPGFIDGVAHYTLQLVRALAEARPNWDWIWMGRRGKFFSCPYRREGRVRIIQPTHSWFPPYARLATATIRLLKPSILHIQDQIHSFFETGAATDIAGAANCPIAVTLHEYHNELPSVKNTAALIRIADFLAANDARTAQRAANFVGRPVDQTWWSPSNLLPATGFDVTAVNDLCVTFGLLSSIKKLETAYRALTEVRKAFPNLRWRIVGPFDPKNQPLHARLASEFKADWIEFTGSRDDPQDPILHRWLGEASVFLLPFADGASPRRGSLQTGWAFGLPVVTTPPTTPEPSIRDGENCLLASPDDANAWADRVRSILKDETLAARLRAGSRATADRFSWPRLAACHLVEYDRLLDSGRSDRSSAV